MSEDEGSPLAPHERFVLLVSALEEAELLLAESVIEEEYAKAGAYSAAIDALRGLLNSPRYRDARCAAGHPDDFTF